MSAKVEYIQRAIGLTPEQLPADKIPTLLNKMMLDAKLDGDGTRSWSACPSRGPT